MIAMLINGELKMEKRNYKSAVVEFYDLDNRTIDKKELKYLEHLIIRYDAEFKCYINQYDEIINLSEIARKYKIRPQSLQYAIKVKKMPLDKAVKKLYEKRNLKELAEMSEIPYATLYARVKYYGYTLEEALKLPLRYYKNKKERKNGK